MLHMLIALMLMSLPLERDPDSRPPTSGMQRIANMIHLAFKWTKTPEALVSLSYQQY